MPPYFGGKGGGRDDSEQGLGKKGPPKGENFLVKRKGPRLRKREKVNNAVGVFEWHSEFSKTELWKKRLTGRGGERLARAGGEIRSPMGLLLRFCYIGIKSF